MQSFRLYLCIIVFSAAICTSVQAQQDKEALLRDRFNEYNQQVLQEKLYVHTDKNFYLAGEICWFKIYNTDAFFHKPLGLSKLAYLEVLDKNNKPVLQAKVPIKEGDGNGSLQLPISLVSGKYLLRAYTSWMKNFSEAYFFEKPITIVNTRKVYEGNTLQKKNKYDIQLFPEGGNLVNGIQSKVAFRVVDQNGKGLSCRGIIISDKADTVGYYTTVKFGMGNFLLTPEAGHTYKAITVLPDSSHIILDLPLAYNDGYVMHLGESPNRQLKITVQAPASSYSPPVILFAHTRGSVKAVASGILRNGYAEFFVDIDKLGDGISHFTIFNEERKPVCERLFFKKPVQHLEITATADQPEYEQRKKMDIKILSADQDGKPIPANMSMAVYRIDSLTGPDEMDISNYLWLSSDLVGRIESPGYYFTSQTPETTEALDNLMLTQGWRRFRWEDILQRTTPSFEFAPEYKGHIIRGRVTSNATGQAVKGVECFLSVAGTRTQFRGDISDDSGFVKFEMNNFYGNSEIIVQSAGQEDSLRHVEIMSPYADKYSVTILPEFSLPEKNAATLLNQNVSVLVQNTYAGHKLKQFIAPSIDTMPFYIKPDAAYMLDDYVRFTTLEEVLREYVPDVNVRRRDGKFYFPVFDHIRKEFFQVDPLVLLDGVPVFDINKLMRYDPLKIKKLEVVARMYFYGNMYFGGIVNFITYKGDLPGYELDPHATVIDYETLQMQREFFSPVYETQEQSGGRLPDFRTLLHWLPVVKTNKEGKQETVFYTSDMPGQFAVVLQGITADGKTGSKTIFFRVKENDSVAGKK
ncbi:MAG: hypothetical protein ABIR15_23495 [Chitinophagaceae bacterium]